MGKVIVITGSDGSGKQTQSEMLVSYLKNNNKKVKLQSFPNYKSKSATMVKAYLNGEFGSDVNSLNAYSASVLFAVDRLYTMKKYKKFIEKKDTFLILDRYTESNILHQACKIDDKAEKAKTIEWLYDLEFNKMKLPKPTDILFLDMPYSYAKKLREERGELKSGTKNDIHESNEEFMKKSYENGIDLAKKQGWKIISCIENNKILSREEIHKKILNALGLIK